ncbi:MAG: helix-turn-helix transcriptional regulator [Solirubrobacteraceae bacterium]
MGFELTLDGPTTAQRVALAQLAIAGCLRGDSRDRIVVLADLAWEGDAALDDKAADVMVPMAGALVFADELERCLEIVDDPLMRSRQRRSRSLAITAAFARTWSLYHQGRVLDALRTAQSQPGLGPQRDRRPTHGVDGALAACQCQRGQLDEAERSLSMLHAPDRVLAVDLPLLYEVRAQLRLAQARPDDALGDALEAGRRSQTDAGGTHPGVVPWRSTAALALLEMGDQAGARRLASEALEAARAGGPPRATIRALRVLARATTRRHGLQLLNEAVELGRSRPERFEYLHAVVDLGAALRAANRRGAAHKLLAHAAQLCDERGATVLAQRAADELELLPDDGGLAALTRGERRVADLAARSATTRQIAAELFVTPKTVEFHLRNVYRKLAIPSTRAALMEAFDVERTLSEDAARP